MCWEVSSLPQQKDWSMGDGTSWRNRQVACDMWLHSYLRQISASVAIRNRPVTTISLHSANRSTFGSAPRIKVLNLQLSTWMNSYLYQVPGRRQPTPSSSSFPFKSTAELEIIYRFMEKSDSIPVRNFGFENSTIPPSKWWQYVGLRTFKFSPCVPHPAVNNQRTRVLAILTEAPGSTSQKPSRCIWQMYFRLASFDTVHESVFTNSYKFEVSII